MLQHEIQVINRIYHMWH